MYILKNKSDVFNTFFKWKKMVETKTRKKIKQLITDNVGKFYNDQFLKLCKMKVLYITLLLEYTTTQCSGRMHELDIFR